MTLNIPGMKAKDPNLLLKIIEGVEECVKEQDIDIEEKKNQGVEVTEVELSNYSHDNLEKLTESRKGKFLIKFILLTSNTFPTYLEMKSLVYPLLFGVVVVPQ